MERGTWYGYTFVLRPFEMTLVFYVSRQYATF